ncbi:MAG: hypothetical protein ITG02_15205 [Patulibacter sp.]|nr:hypothetical protein [Patulibacter sp.]
MSSFIDAVAERTQLKPELARQILEARGIVLQPQAAAPAALQLERLAFNGTKRLAGQDPEPIAVHHEFEAGLTAVTSTKNLMGKSSVLWLIRWGLTGRRPSDLADDVRRWLDEVSLEGTVGTEHFSVHWQIKDGASAEGSLTVGDTTATFDTPEGFEETMAAFMLDRLRLSATPWWKRQREGHDDEGTVSLHGWRVCCTSG